MPSPSRPVQIDLADPRRYADATQRNRGPLLAELQRFLPAHGQVLEVASGTGEHVSFFAPHFPALTFQPTDPDPGLRLSIAAWVAHVGAGNVLPPLELDAAAWPWPVSRADFVLNVNMIHIAPWAACEGLMHGAGALLPPGGRLFMYGPFQVDGRHTAPSNQEFDAALRAMRDEWGVRDLGAVTAAAARHGLTREAVVPMPSNNLSVVFTRQ